MRQSGKRRNASGYEAGNARCVHRGEQQGVWRWMEGEMDGRKGRGWAWVRGCVVGWRGTAMSGCERKLIFTASAVKMGTDQGETAVGIRNGQSIRQMDFEV